MSAVDAVYLINTQKSVFEGAMEMKTAIDPHLDVTIIDTQAAETTGRGTAKMTAIDHATGLVMTVDLVATAMPLVKTIHP